MKQNFSTTFGTHRTLAEPDFRSNFASSATKQEILIPLLPLIYSSTEIQNNNKINEKTHHMLKNNLYLIHN